MFMKCRYLVHVLVIVFTFCGFMNMRAEEITKADILKTLEHIQQLSKEQKTSLEKAQADYQQQAAALQEQIVLTQKWQSEAKANARQRDVLLYLFAGCMAAYLGTFFAGVIMREFPTPWNIICAALAYLGVGAAFYTLGRYFLATLAHLIP